MGRRRKVNENLFGLTTKLFPYEILVPLFYEICYSGLEGPLSGGGFNNTIELCNLKNKDFKGCIWIYNFFPIPIDISSEEFYEEQDKDRVINKYKNIISKCNYILLKMNDRKEIENLEVFYTKYYSCITGSPKTDSIELLSDKFPTRDFIALKRY